jgi:hypothetical protein
LGILLTNNKKTTSNQVAFCFCADCPINYSGVDAELKNNLLPPCFDQ